MPNKRSENALTQSKSVQIVGLKKLILLKGNKFRFNNNCFSAANQKFATANRNKENKI